MMYPFSLGDLRDSSFCLANYMETNAGGKIPWEDLKYIFGEIMYGGHIVNDFDRLLANTYLDWFMKDELLDEMEMFPYAEDEKDFSFMSPTPTSYDRYIEHIEEQLKQDTPIAFGLHPNAEIGFRTTRSEGLFHMLVDLQPRDGASAGEGLSPQHVAENVLNEILDRFGEISFDIEDVQRSLEVQGPYQNVFLQECDKMNTLIVEIKRSLYELNLGFAGELTMSDNMDMLLNSMFLDRVPATWAKRAWPSLRTLSTWLFNMSERIVQLQAWVENPLEIPRVTWIAGLINPQSFLTAICQTTAQNNKWELDKLLVFTDITKRAAIADVDSASRDGAYIFGLALQGARWDIQGGVLDKSQPKEMFCKMPVMNARATSVEKAETAGIYQCPTYKTEQRGPTFVFSAQLKTKSAPGRWVLAGAAMIMDVVA